MSTKINKQSIKTLSLKQAKQPNAIDRMVAEDRFEYKTGKLKSFIDTQEALDYLYS